MKTKYLARGGGGELGCNFSPVNGALDELNTILVWINRNTASGTRKERAPLHSVLDNI